MRKTIHSKKLTDFCASLRTGLDLQPADYSYDPWNTVQIYDGGLFHCNDKDAAFALYDFGDEISPECARKLGSCRLKRLMNEYLAGVSFNVSVTERDLKKRMSGQDAAIPSVYAYCFKLIPVTGELFRGKDINEDGMFEIKLSPRDGGLFDPPDEELPRKNGAAIFPLRLRLSGGLSAEPPKFSFFDAKRLKGVAVECGGERYEFLTGTGYEIPDVVISKSRTGEDQDGAYIDVLLEMNFRGFGIYG